MTRRAHLELLALLELFPGSSNGHLACTFAEVLLLSHLVNKTGFTGFLTSVLRTRETATYANQGSGKV
jgi:hypothetical protein